MGRHPASDLPRLAVWRNRILSVSFPRSPLAEIERATKGPNADSWVSASHTFVADSHYSYLAPWPVEGAGMASTQGQAEQGWGQVLLCAGPGEECKFASCHLRLSLALWRSGLPEQNSMVENTSVF